MKTRKTIVLLGAAMIATPAGATDRTDDFLTPHVAVGDRLDSVFAKTTAITGSGFSPVVLRVSGSTSDKIAAVSADEIREEEHYVYDGFCERRRRGASS